MLVAPLLFLKFRFASALENSGRVTSSSEVLSPNQTIPPITTLDPALMTFFMTAPTSAINEWLSEAVAALEAHATFTWDGAQNKTRKR